MKKEQRSFEIGEMVWFVGGSTFYPQIEKSKITRIADPWEDGKHQLLLSLESKTRPKIVSGCVFKSREALCEHYRKIFE